MKTLTASGAGLMLDRNLLAQPDSIQTIQGLLDQYRFLVLKRAFDSTGEAVSFLANFGPINAAASRTEGAVMVENQSNEEVFRSDLALPLHKDGILTGFDVVLVGIYCVEFTQVTGGRTYVVDSERALQQVPQRDVEQLRKHGIEGMAVDSGGYYRQEYEGNWHPFPAFKAKDGRAPSLNLGLPHAPGEPESWRLRVAGVERERSDEILGSLRNALLDDEFAYYHDWTQGDIIMIDNYAALHGREAFHAESRRLANIQVLNH